MPLLNSLGVNGDASATRRLPRRRNLVRNALREVEQFFPREQWMTVVVQGDQTVRVALLGGEHSRALEQPAGAASTSTTTIPPPTARSAPSRRIVQQNRRAALHQAALKFCSNRLLKLAFRGFRMHSAFGSTSASADEASRRASSPSPAPSQEMMQTDDDFAITVSSSSEKRTVSVRDGESSRDRSHSPPSHRARRDAAGSEAARGLSSTSTMGGPSTAVYVPPLPPLPPPPIPILPPPPPELAAMARMSSANACGDQGWAAPSLSPRCSSQPKAGPSASG